MDADAAVGEASSFRWQGFNLSQSGDSMPIVILRLPVVKLKIRVPWLSFTWRIPYFSFEN
jgi:hypothetical protein